MWHLELLSRVTAAFGALAKEFIEGGIEQTDLSQDANDCYSDIVGIGIALSRSRGEWTQGLNDEHITRLLSAFETRLPTRWAFGILTSRLDHGLAPIEWDQFPSLKSLSRLIDEHSLGGYDECLNLLYQTSERHQQYVNIIGRHITLFHQKERISKRKRDKFLDRVRAGSKHLLDAYFRDGAGVEDEELTLSQHPSHEVKDLADTVYNLLEHHWKHQGIQLARTMTGRREARLSLVRHRLFAPKLLAKEIVAQSRLPAKFEVLLPVAADGGEWKVTHVEIAKRSVAKAAGRTDRQLVNQDIAQRLLDSRGFQVDFLAEHGKLWHFRPDLLEEISHYTSMNSLQQMLGDGVSISDIANHTPREKLILCYILANSLLFFYPGSWFQAAWNSNNVYFVRRAMRSSGSILTFPYLSVELQQAQQTSKDPPHYMQYHPHPVILALGIILLEIATGAKFVRRSIESTPWKQCNSDGQQALDQLISFERQSERHRSKRISHTLRGVIRSCLMLRPPPEFPSNNLSEEGPIRYYILSCIIQPLVWELRKGHKVSLEELHTALGLEMDVRATTCSNDLGCEGDKDQTSPTGPPYIRNSLDKAEPTFNERHELCLLGDNADTEVLVDENKKSMANKWFTFHEDAVNRVKEMRKDDLANAQRVKIAILDSGIDLNSDQDAMYNFEPKIEYQSWIDSDGKWKDDVGHGTHLAVLLRKIAPDAVIHVARVFKKKPKINSSAKVIAQAIRHAVDEWKVDIIVMSFGFGDKDEMIYKQIKYAAYKEVLMFAAACNDGKNRPGGGVAWPAEEQEVICVHSGDGFGNASPFTPSPRENMKVMVLGECVHSAWPQKLQSPGDRKYMSGTSCAAPIAAGIAALVLDFARGFLSEEDWKKLRRTRSMRRMFRELRDADSDTGHWWIKHWELFSPNRDASWIEGEIRGYIC